MKISQLYVKQRLSPKMIISLTLQMIIFAVAIESLFLDNANINLNNELPHSSRISEESDTTFSSNTMGSRGTGRFNCPQKFETCLSLCCLPGETLVNSSCIGESDTIEILLRNKTFIHNDGVEEVILEKNYHVFRSDPCDIGWMTGIITKNFHVFKNGSISAPEFDEGSLLDFDYYCLKQDQETFEYLAKVCRPWIRRSDFMVYCLTFSLLIMLAILIIHTTIPEMQNLHGLIFRSYVIAYVGVYVGMLGVLLTIELRINILWILFCEIACRYFCGCCMLWLNVMSFNICRSFRGLRQIPSNDRKKKRKQFMWYSIYVWFSPTILAVVAVVIISVCLPRHHIDKIDDIVRQGISVGVIVIVYFCNIVLYTMTALNIRRQKNDILNLADVPKENYEINKLWFNLYLKLFVLMGGHVITWGIFLLWRSHNTMHLVGVLEVVQGVIVFTILFRKSKIKLSVFNRFGESWMSNINLRKLFSTRHPVREGS